MSNKPTIPPSPSTGGDDTLRNYLVEEFVEDYQQGQITRREALKKIAKIFGSLTVATKFLAACAPAPTATQAPAAPTAPTAPTANHRADCCAITHARGDCNCASNSSDNAITNRQPIHDSP